MSPYSHLFLKCLSCWLPLSATLASSFRILISCYPLFPIYVSSMSRRSDFGVFFLYQIIHFELWDYNAASQSFWMGSHPLSKVSLSQPQKVVIKEKNPQLRCNQKVGNGTQGHLDTLPTPCTSTQCSPLLSQRSEHHKLHPRLRNARAAE